MAHSVHGHKSKCNLFCSQRATKANNQTNCGPLNQRGRDTINLAKETTFANEVDADADYDVRCSVSTAVAAAPIPAAAPSSAAAALAPLLPLLLLLGVAAVAVCCLWADMERDVHNLLADKTNSL